MHTQFFNFIQIIDGLQNKSYLTQGQKPLRLPTVDKAIENSPSGSPWHIKLVAEWDAETKGGIFDKFPEEKVRDFLKSFTQIYFLLKIRFGESCQHMHSFFLQNKSTSIYL